MKTNKFILILAVFLLALLPLVSSAEYRDFHTVTLGTADADARQSGVGFNTTQNITIEQIFKHSSNNAVGFYVMRNTTATICNIGFGGATDENFAQIGTGLYSSDTGTPTTQINLTPNNCYIITSYGHTNTQLATTGAPKTGNQSLFTTFNFRAGNPTSDLVTYQAYNGFGNIISISFNLTTSTPPPTPSPTISFQGQTPSNATTQYLLTASNFTVNTTTSNFGGTVTTRQFLYNSSFGLIQQNNQTSGTSYTSSFNVTTAGTYYFNATATNTTHTNITETRTIYIYDLTTGTQTTPSNNSIINYQYINITWTNSTINPVASGVRVQNFSISLFNSTLGFNATIGATSQLNFSNYNLFGLNLATGLYWIRITSQDNNGKTVFTQSQINLTRNAILNITVRDARNSTILSIGNITATDLLTNEIITASTTNGNLNLITTKGRSYNLISNFNGYSYGNQNVTLDSVNTTQYLNISLYTNNSVNISIYDESTGILINQSVLVTFTSSTETTYSATNGVLYVDNLLDGTYTVKFTSSSYSQKTYTLTVFNRSAQNLNAYLSQNSTAVIFTILDFDSASTLSGASFTQYRFINSSWVIVDTKTSDITGRVQVYAVAGIQYQFLVSLSGYSSNNFYLNPVIFSTYNVRLTKTTTLSSVNTPDGNGVSVTYGSTNFYTNQSTNFIWTISSPIGSLSNYTLNISYPSSQTLYSGSNAIGEQFNKTVSATNTALTDKVYISYCYDTTTANNKCFQYSYFITGSYGNYTMMSNKNTTYGLGVFERTLIVTILVLIVAGIGGLAGGVITSAVLTLFLYGYFYYMGFIPLWSILPSLLIGIIFIMGRSE